MAIPFQVQAYSAFLSVLGKDATQNPSVSRDQLLGGIAYYLTALPHPYVQSFGSLTISSPALWGAKDRSSLFDKVQPSACGVRQATQQAVVAKYTALQADPEKSSMIPGLGRQRVQMAFTEWLDLLLTGVRSSDSALPRLAFLSGLILGLKSLEKQDIHVPRKSFERCCGEMIVSVAECLDQYVMSADPSPAWDVRLALQSRDTEPHLDIVVELCAAVLPLVSDSQLVALDLSVLAYVCLGSALQVFRNGHCFDLLESELVRDPSGLLAFKPDSKLPQEMELVHNSALYIHLGTVSKMIGHIFICMAQSRFWRGRLYPVLAVYAEGFSEASLALERSWSRSLLSEAKTDEDIKLDARPTTTKIWHILKSSLFTSVLVSQSALDVGIYYNAIPLYQTKVLSRTILVILCRLSFISTKFGALTAEGGGFSEMKRAFFGALDVLAFNYDDQDTSGDQSCVELITNLAKELSAIGESLGSNHSILRGRITYFLVCAEHVMNQIPDDVVAKTVLPILQRHLSDADNREVYEAAHSVMLAIFTAQDGRTPRLAQKPVFQRAGLLVPAYIDALLLNSGEDRLSTSQLCLAFQSLVRGANSRDEALGWYCIEQLVSAIEKLAHVQPSVNKQITRLQLALISSMSAVSISQLPLVLETLHGQILSNRDSQGELANAAYREIIEHLGDREKDIGLKWWIRIKGSLGIST